MQSGARGTITWTEQSNAGYLERCSIGDPSGSLTEVYGCDQAGWYRSVSLLTFKREPAQLGLQGVRTDPCRSAWTGHRVSPKDTTNQPTPLPVKGTQLGRYALPAGWIYIAFVLYVTPRFLAFRAMPVFCRGFVGKRIGINQSTACNARGFRCILIML